MKDIDQRIVQMQFDNKQFENGIQTSISSLNSLKKGLELEGATRGLSDLERAGRRFSLDGLADSVDHIASRFNALSIIGITALVNLTNSAINYGKRMVSALTIDPIKTGLQEYETKMNAITTILTNTQSKGTTLDDVNKALVELNEYADKTIYNFAEMTRNIGTFTAAGIELDVATKSIKGIANLAAGSGSNAQQASTAMYQLSQALAAGSVKLQDWNSVVNAGMGGELFQNALKQTAKEMGIFVNSSKPFRETLQDGWITAEVLTKTLEKFAEDETLVKAATQVKTFTQLIDTMKESVQSGWAVSWEHIIGDREQAITMLTSISDAFNNLVGPSADARNEMLKFWNENGGRDAIIESITNALIALHSVLRPIKEAFREVFPAMTGERIVDISKRIKELSINFKIGEETALNIKRTFKGLFSLLDIGKKSVKVISSVLLTLTKQLFPLGDGLLGVTGNIGDFLTSLNDSIQITDTFSASIENVGVIVRNTFSKIGETIKKSAPVMYKTAEFLGKIFENIQTRISNAFNNSDFNGLFDVVNGGIFSAILLAIQRLIWGLSDVTKNAGGFIKGTTEILDGVKDSLKAYQAQLKAGILLKIATAIGILAASLVVLSLIDSGKLASSLAAMGVMFTQLLVSMAMFDKIPKSSGFLSMSRTAVTMIAMSTAILILASAMTKLSKLDWNGIAKGLIGVGVLAAQISVFMSMTNFKGFGMSKGVGLLLLATSITILAEAVKKFGELDVTAILKGLTGIGIMLAQLAVFVNLTGNAKHVITTAAGLTILGGAMLIFGKAIENMGAMSWDTIGRGLTTMAGALSIMSVALRMLPKSMFITGTGLLVISTALVVLSKAITNIGNMSWENIAKGIVLLSGALTVIAISMAFMTTALPGATALLVISGALAILTPILMMFGKLSLSEIGSSLIALAGAFTVIGVAGLLLGPLIPVLMGLAGTVALLGIGFIAAGAGIMMFSAGLTTLSVAGVAGTAALVAMVSGVIGLIPNMFTTLAQGIIRFAKAIGDGAPVIVEAVFKIMTSILDTLHTYVPKIVDTGVKLILALLKGISQNMKDVVVTGVEIIVNFLDGVATMIPVIIQAGFDLMLAFINGLADSIRNNTPFVIDAMDNLGLAVIESVLEVFTDSYVQFVDIGKDIISGLIEGMKSMITAIGKATSEIGESIINSAKSVLGIHSPSRVFKEQVGEMVGLGMAQGIKSSGRKATKASSEVAKDVVDAAKEAFNKSVEWIDERKYYNQLSLTEELEAWKRVQQRYLSGTEERKKADREIYRVKQELIKEEEELSKKSFNHSIEWIDERKYYNQLSLSEELSAWERVQQRYLSGTEERKKADREVYRVKQEMISRQKKIDEDYYAKSKEINENLKRDIKSVNDEYDRALKSRTESLYNTYGLFDKVESPEVANGQELLQNLEGQVEAFDTWRQSISELSTKGIDQELLKELEGMGPKSTAQIQALNRLSSTELDQYASLWRIKHNNAKTQAIAELEGLRVETSNKISQLNADAAIQLEEYKTQWITQTKELSEAVDKEFKEMKDDVKTTVSNLKKETEKEFSTLATNIKRIMGDQDWPGVGANIIHGMTGGVRATAWRLAQEAADAAYSALEAAKDVLGIHSPSKEFEKLGMYVNEGFVIGLTKYASGISDSARGMGDSAISSLQTAISKISDLMVGEIDLSPVIRPVLDLDSVTNDASKLGALFSQRQGINVSGVVDKIPNISNNKSVDTTATPIGKGNEPTTIQFTQNNYSPKPLSRLEIYRNTRNQISTMKGMVGLYD